MATNYPASVDNFISLPTATDNFTPVRAVTVNALRDSIIAVQAAVGAQPAGTYGTVSARLDFLETNTVIIGGDISGSDSGLIVVGFQSRAISSAEPVFGQSYVWNGAEWTPDSPGPGGPASGDLAGSYPNPMVAALQGNPVSSLMPTTNQFLSWNGTEWAPSSIGPSFIAGGDLGGYATTQTVIGIQGKPVSATPPTTGQALVFNGTQYVPTTQSASVTFSNDLSGNTSSQTVVGLQSHPLANTSPVASAVPIYNSSLARYDIRQLTGDDIGAAFSITGFSISVSGGTTLEIGQSVSNPTFTMSYSAPPSSATLIDTPTNGTVSFSSPYTSGSITGTFQENSQTYTSFTLTAVGATTQNAYQYIYWYPRSFAGVGAAGATSSVTADGNTAILSTSDILSDEGLYSSFVGQSVSFTASSQNLYFLLTGGSHTFTDNSNQNPFPFNSPTPVSFVNQYSQTVSMYLYQSSTTLTGTYSIKVSS